MRGIPASNTRRLTLLRIACALGLLSLGIAKLFADFSDVPPWYRLVLQLAACLEAMLGVALLVSGRTRVCAIAVTCLGLAFLAWSSVLGPSGLVGRRCGCFGTAKPSFVVQMTVALAITVGGATLWFGSSERPQG